MLFAIAAALLLNCVAANLTNIFLIFFVLAAIDVDDIISFEYDGRGPIGGVGGRCYNLCLHWHIILSLLQYWCRPHTTAGTFSCLHNAIHDVQL